MDIRSHRRVSAALAGGIATLALFVAPTSVRAATADTCIGAQRLWLASPLTRVPSLSTIPFELSGSASCVVHGSISWTGRGALDPGSSCGSIAALTGNAAFLLPRWVDSTTNAGGPTSSQGWTYTEVTGGSFTAEGTFSWLNTAELNDCRRPAGTIYMSTTGTISYET